MNGKIRVRFAPSPTGYLHIGSARTALFNFLFARREGGAYLLRIEDTDYSRSMDEYIKDIEEGLKWLELAWDEGPGKKGKFGPYRQSKRLSIYKKYIDESLSKGFGYYCYCTDEELEKQRQDFISKGRAPRYDGRCRNLKEEDIKRFQAEGRKPVIRFRMPDDIIYVDDLIKGKIKFDCSLIGDFVILKSDGTPSYNFAAVIDDHLMKISHVIRGEDHISNTPKQLMLYKAFGFEPPSFAHLPMILGEDRGKLSKRHGAVSVLEYKKLGYLPEAIRNFLALLGWSPKDNREIMPLDELIRNFKLEGVAKSPAVFTIDKLNWMNGNYIRSLDEEELAERIKPYLKEAHFNLKGASKDFLKGVAAAIKDNLTVLSEAPKFADVFFIKDIDYEEIKETLYHKDSSSVISALKDKLSKAKKFDHDSLNGILGSLVNEFKLPKGKVFKAARVVLTGKTSGPELWRIINLFGKEKCLKRLSDALEKRKV